MKIKTKIHITAWALLVAGLIYAVVVPVGHVSLWVLIPTVLLSFPLFINLALVLLQPLPDETDTQCHKVIIDGVEYVPIATAKSPQKSQ